MATTALKGHTIQLKGDLPQVGSQAPEFTLTTIDLQDLNLKDFKGQKLILNIFPSVDTGICAASVRTFNQKAADLENATVLCISRDTPMAHRRFCGAEGIEDVISLSQIRNTEFMDNYGVELAEGAMAGFFARCVVVIDEAHKVLYTQITNDITEEPDYEAALAAAK